ncbi:MULTISPECIES: TldD/PmbA family protein [Paenibacillus]|uniref:TldD protein n=1 Tax=Paenibacillus pabuli TaxID=1472 RepID=A0A855XXK7_9BACL|nr:MULTISPECIES: TldD/PmbA family protein [Paenibacillus]PWW32687.1 TldD protein [Paenibacillus pabuli]PXV98364.1 TldD protein [Paenibacillus taichungensis]
MLSQIEIEKMLTAALETGGDFAEVFVEDKTNASLSMLGGVLEKAVSGRDFGIGIRILKGDFCVYAYTNDFAEENLIKVARSAAQGIQGQKQDITLNLIKKETFNAHHIEIPTYSIGKKEKIDWLRRAHYAAKDYDPVIGQTQMSYSETIQNVLIANTEGIYVEDRRTRNILNFMAIATSGTNMETGYVNPGYVGGLEHIRNLDIESCAREAARSAKTILNADYAPSGKFPVIIDNAFGGVLFHEACGHGLEATCVADNASVFSGKLGEYVASPLVSAYDDGTIANAWGSENIDDEGMPSQRNLLIENGILKGYLIDKIGSRKMNMAPTGSARRESYRYSPTSRMTNTFIASGNSTPEEIISNTEYGIFAKYMGGGSVNTATGEYNFNVSEGYMVKNGKLVEPIKGATLIGDGMSTLKNIDMVGSNLDYGVGMCGARSGTIPVTVGQPTIRVSELTVGGR